MTCSFDLLSIVQRPLTYDEICQLAKISRPAVSMALRNLEFEKRLERGFVDKDGYWIPESDDLSHEPAWRPVL